MPYMSYIYGETMEKRSKRRTGITRKKQIIDRITELTCSDNGKGEEKQNEQD
jgi:phenylpyruvate tautomerase PptA (4-oxalocrotonate tautomerase family)